jgi:hypothetical protein
MCKFSQKITITFNIYYGGKEEMCGHENNVNLFNTDKIWNMG